MADRQRLYKYIKVAGIASFIPFVLLGGLLAGYIAGDFLRQRLGAPEYVVRVFIGLGLLAAGLETVRIIKLLIALTRNS